MLIQELIYYRLDGNSDFTSCSFRELQVQPFPRFENRTSMRRVSTLSFQREESTRGSASCPILSVGVNEGTNAVVVLFGLLTCIPFFVHLPLSAHSVDDR